MLRPIALALFTLGLTSSAIGQVTAASEVRTAAVSVIAFDPAGNRLDPPEVSIFESSDGRDFSARFSEGKADHIPFGTYRVGGRVTGFWSEYRYVRIFAASVTVVLGLSPGTEAPQEPAVLRGRIVGMDGKADLFIRVASVLSGTILEAVPDGEGRFLISGHPPMGDVLVSIVGKGRIVAARIVHLPIQSGREVEVRIGEGIPPEER